VTTANPSGRSFTLWPY